jgi:hypothetical protein
MKDQMARLRTKAAVRVEPRVLMRLIAKKISQGSPKTVEMLIEEPGEKPRTLMLCEGDDVTVWAKP